MPRIDFVVVVWSMIASASVTLAAVHLMAWMSERRRASLAFVALTSSVAAFALIELALMRAPSADAFATTVRWAHVVIFLMVVAVVAFVRETFPEQRSWLGIAALAARAFAVVANFTNGNANLNFVEVTGLRPGVLFGSEIVLPVGVPSLWTLYGSAASLLLFVYVVDAAIRHGRAGVEARRRAIVLGGGIALFVGAAQLLSFATNRLLPIPYMVSLPYLGVAAVMAWQMSRDMVRTTRLARELAESERRTELAARGARAGFWIWREGTGLWADEIARTLHATDEREPATTLEAFLAPGDPSMGDALRALSRENGSDEFELEFVVATRDGTQRWIRSRGVVERNGVGRVLALHGGSIDISDRRHAEARFRSVFEAAPTALLVIDGLGSIMLANRRAEALFGAESGGLIGRRVTELADASHQWPGVARGPDHFRELHARRLDGSAFIAEVALDELPSADGPQFLAAVFDATARIEHDREMQRLREQFANASRISLAGQLASTLAHELSQPLAAILRNAETAGRLLERPEPDLTELEAIVDDIRSDDRRAAAIIDHMRSLLRAREPQLGPVSLGEVLSRTATFVRHDAASHRVLFELHVPAGLPPIHADAVHVEQVVLNLLYNAMQALQQVPPGSRHMRLHAREVSDCVELVVSDTGPGIPADVLPRLFDPFVSTRTDGMGMGLAISRTLVDGMGGRLDAGNAIGGGAVFRVTWRRSVT